MTAHGTLTRRDAIAGVASLGAGALAPFQALSQVNIPTRPIRVSGEPLPVVGLGSSKVVQQIAAEGAEPLARVLRTLVDHGGAVVDTWPRNPDNDAAVGRVINEPRLEDNLFVTTKIDRRGRDAGRAQFRSLKYILPHPAVTCVLTETTNPAHMAENALASVGAMPDEDARARMRTFIDGI